MVEIEIIEEAEGFAQGEVVSVPNNDAHRLIDGGKAKLTYVTRLMEPEQGGYEAPSAQPAPSEPVHAEEQAEANPEKAEDAVEAPAEEQEAEPTDEVTPADADNA